MKSGCFGGADGEDARGSSAITDDLEPFVAADQGRELDLLCPAYATQG